MFSKDEFIRLLQEVRLTEKEKQMLVDVCRSGESGMTASELAPLLGVSSHVVVNRMFGGLGHKISDAANRKPEMRQDGSFRWWRVLADYRVEKGRGFVWIPHKELQEAVEKLWSTETRLSANVEKQFEEAVRSSLMDSATARRERLMRAPKLPNQTEVLSTAFQRNPDVVAEVLIRADGYCEKCKNPAPFLRRSDNSPYLEVHHVTPLADGGTDTVKNAVALCPNCHREAHYA